MLHKSFIKLFVYNYTASPLKCCIKHQQHISHCRLQNITNILSFILKSCKGLTFNIFKGIQKHRQCKVLPLCRGYFTQFSVTRFSTR